MRNCKSAVVAALVVAAAGCVLALQGWGGRVVTLDCIPAVRQASRFLQAGVLPPHDCLTSLGSFLPPGTAWLFLPGLTFFKNPLLVGYPASLLLYGMTLWGVYRLGESTGGGRAGLGSFLLFAVSGVGLTSAASLWPRFPLAASVWMIYWLVVWVVKRRAWAVSASLVCWGLGLYVHPEGLLFLPVFPVTWLIWRPPLRFSPMAVAFVVVLVVWFPYARFERTRGFVDMRSMLLRQNLLSKTRLATPAPVPGVARRPEEGSASVDSAQALGPVSRVSARALLTEWVERGLAVAQEVPSKLGATLCLSESNTKAGWVLGSMMFIFAVAWTGAAFVRLHATGVAWFPALSPNARAGMGTGFLLLAFLANEWWVGRGMRADGVLESYNRHVVRAFQIAMASCGVLLVWWPRIAGRVRMWIEASHPEPAVVAVALVIPWMGALCMTSEGEPCRFWVLWPLQVTLLASSIVWLAARCPSRVLRGTLVVVFGLPIAANAVMMQRLADWRQAGWQGKGQIVPTLDALGGAISRQHDHAPRIGYFVDQADWVRQYHALDAQYKIGMQMDWYLERRYGVTNGLLVADGRDGSENYRLLEIASPDAVPLVNLNPNSDWWIVAANTRYIVQCRNRIRDDRREIH